MNKRDDIEILEKCLAQKLNNLHNLIKDGYKAEDQETLLIMKNDLMEKFKNMMAILKHDEVDVDNVNSFNTGIEESLQLIEDYLEALSL
jgi:hypothetical protein